jgi:hypothetical protein
VIDCVSSVDDLRGGAPPIETRPLHTSYHHSSRVVTAEIIYFFLSGGGSWYRWWFPAGDGKKVCFAHANLKDQDHDLARSHLDYEIAELLSACEALSCASMQPITEFL